MSFSSASFTCGPVGAADPTGIGPRLSGISTVINWRLSSVHSKLVINVARTGVLVTWRALPVAASATQRWLPSGVCPKKATLFPSGLQIASEIRSPAGNPTVVLDPSSAEINSNPALLRIVRVRFRLARKSTNRPPSSWNGFENTSIVTGPSPSSLMNQVRSELISVKATFR